MNRARWDIYSAYPHADATHPLVARYPAAMHAACDEHLPVIMAGDSALPFGTRMFVVKQREADRG